MDAIALTLVEDPLRYISYALALAGAVGVLYFVLGFSSGLPHFFTFNESDSHMEHARTRVVQGALICMVALGLWEIVRVIAGQAPASYLWLSLLLLTPLWIPWAIALFKGGGGGH